MTLWYHFSPQLSVEWAGSIFPGNDSDLTPDPQPCKRKDTFKFLVLHGICQFFSSVYLANASIRAEKSIMSQLHEAVTLACFGSSCWAFVHSWLCLNALLCLSHPSIFSIHLTSSDWCLLWARHDIRPWSHDGKWNGHMTPWNLSLVGGGRQWKGKG